MLGALVVVFLVMRVLPGDPAIALLGTAATPHAVAVLRKELGVDRPHIDNGWLVLREAPWLTVFPSNALVLTVIGLNLVRDAIRDALDPRVQEMWVGAAARGRGAALRG